MLVEEGVEREIVADCRYGREISCKTRIEQGL